MGKSSKLSGITREVLVVALAALMIVVGFVPAKAAAPLGNSTFLAQTQTQNLSGINGATTSAYMAQSVVLNGVVYFVGNSPTTGPELYSTDGTSAGTNLVKDVYPGTVGYVNLLSLSNGKLYFNSNGATGGYEPYVSDGTAAGTVLLKDINPNGSSSPSGFTQGANGLTYFLANDGSTSLTAGSTNVDNGSELWVTDGTTAGTRKVKDVNTYSYYVPSNNSYNTSQSVISNLTNCNGRLYFSAAEGNFNNYTELWSTDGTTAGTGLVKDINLNTTTAGYAMYSQALGTTIAVGATISLGSSPASLTCVGTTLYFTADDGTGSRKLYKTDGTSAGTVQVRAIASGSYPTNPTSLFALGNNLVFSALASPYGANNDNYGQELWITDGTDAGTVLLKDINPNTGNSSPSNFVLYNGQAYFSATDARGTELWKTDGTTVGTLFVKDINTTATGAGSNPQYFYVWNNKLFFTANDGLIGQELYVTQGTGVSTVLVKDVFPGISDMLDVSNISTNRPFFAGTTNGLVFVANSPIYGQEMWITDGTMANTIASGTKYKSC
jgi:ELWxxDGT repeat protein